MKESCFIRVNNICFESSFEREFRGPCFTDILINSSTRGRAEPRSARVARAFARGLVRGSVRGRLKIALEI